MATIGTIYVLVNPSIPGLVKVGKTTRSVDIRIKELSTVTGVPSQFILVYEETFKDVDTIPGWWKSPCLAKGTTACLELAAVP